MTVDEWEAAYGHPLLDEASHQQGILSRFPYILNHRKRWLDYQEKIRSYSTAGVTTGE